MSPHPRNDRREKVKREADRDGRKSKMEIETGGKHGGSPLTDTDKNTDNSVKGKRG